MRLLACLLCVLVITACSSTKSRIDEETPEQNKLSERDTPLPAYPKQENLIEFYVSELTSNHFYIDPLSLRVDTDGTVSYTLVVKTAGGATNVSFEGIRCRDDMLRLFATGLSAGTWAKSRLSEWQSIENKPMNRHHAVLSHALFCPEGLPLRDAAQGIDALRSGKSPSIFDRVNTRLHTGN